MKNMADFVKLLFYIFPLSKVKGVPMALLLSSLHSTYISFLGRLRLQNMVLYTEQCIEPNSNCAVFRMFLYIIIHDHSDRTA